MHATWNVYGLYIYTNMYRMPHRRSWLSKQANTGTREIILRKLQEWDENTHNGNNGIENKQYLCIVYRRINTHTHTHISVYGYKYSMFTAVREECLHFQQSSAQDMTIYCPYLCNYSYVYMYVYECVFDGVGVMLKYLSTPAINMGCGRDPQQKTMHRMRRTSLFSHFILLLFVWRLEKRTHHHK